MSTGIRRKVDDLGRVVIPASIRRSLGIREGEPLEVAVDGDQVILSKPTDRCAFCGSTEDLQVFRSKALCRSCVAAVGVLDESLRTGRAVPRPPVATGADGDGLPPWDVGSSPRQAPAPSRATAPVAPTQPATPQSQPATPQSQPPQSQPATPQSQPPQSQPAAVQAVPDPVYAPPESPSPESTTAW